MQCSAIILTALIATAASKSVSVFPVTGEVDDVDTKQACVSSSFNGHTCPSSCSGMQDISSAAITTAEQCVAACCADPKVPICTYAGFNAAAKNRCIAGDWHKCPSCKRGADTTFLVNFGPTPPGPPPPPPPSPPPPSPPSPSPPPSPGPPSPSPSPPPGGSTTSIFTLADADQAVLVGCQIEGVNPTYLRSGSTAQQTSASLVLKLTPGSTITGVDFAYTYVTGYKGTVGANFKLNVANTAVYTSPNLHDYPYTKASPVYSPPVHVAANGLSVAVPPSGGDVAFNFDNIDKNLQLALPMQINITCTGSKPCFTSSAPPAPAPPPPPGLLPSFFNDNMVLQRAPQSAAIWGFGTKAGSQVTVAITAGKSFSAMVGSDGSWLVPIAQPASTTGVTITVSNGGRTQVLNNVLFGDVFFCSGQSNMAYSLNEDFNATAEIEDSINYPYLRMWTAATIDGTSPAQDIVDAQSTFRANASVDIGPYRNSSWAVSEPAAFVSPFANYFTWPSAVCYLTGRDIYKRLGGNVPIGLMTASWGGEPIEPFMSADAAADTTCGGTNPASEQTELVSQTQDVGGTNGIIYNGMIAPLIPMKFAAIFWYQGESNDNAAVKYACSFPALITDWRTKMKSPELPFYFVQLAPCDQHQHWCGDFTNVRNAQMAALKLNHTGYAVAVDLGDEYSPSKSVHTRRKPEISRRLALEAMRMQYNEADIVSRGPQFASAAAVGSTLTISYIVGSAGTLHSSGTADCGVIGSKLCCGESPFEVAAAGGGGGWQRAKFIINSNNEVVLTMPAGVTASATTAVRYDWQTWPQCALYNGVGGFDNHTGIAGTPFCWTGTGPCPV